MTSFCPGTADAWFSFCQIAGSWKGGCTYGYPDDYMDARFVQLTATCTADFPNRVRKKERAKDIRKSNRFHLLPNMDPSTYSTDLSLVPALRNTASNTVTSTAISSQRYFLLRRSPGSARHAGTLRRQNIPARRPKSEATARGRESCVNCGNHSNHSNCRS